MFHDSTLLEPLMILSDSPSRLFPAWGTPMVVSFEMMKDCL